MMQTLRAGEPTVSNNESGFFFFSLDSGIPLVPLVPLAPLAPLSSCVRK